MKKLFAKIIGCTLALGILFTGLVGCKDNEDEWKGTGFTNWGATQSVGGFVAETENYVYYINGIADSESNNKFGEPVKGTLMALDKKDMTKTEIVVPQMFTATDYNAGIFIDGGYVYYGTSNTEKQSDGNVASNELVFMKASLKGDNHEVLFNAGDLDTEYRIVKGDDAVYIVYYDDEDTAIKSFNCSTKEEIVVAKQDAETDKNYSLGGYKFVKTDKDDEVAVMFEVTVYAEPYIEEKAEDEDYQRLTESYNLVYAYSAGDAVNGDTGIAGKVVYNGQDKKETATITATVDEYVFFSATTVNNNTTNYGAKVNDLYANGEKVEIVNDTYVSSSMIIESFESAYIYSDSKIYNVSLTGDDKTTKKVVALVDDVSALYAVIGNDIYYRTTATEVARIELNNEKADKVYVTGDLIATSWYAPEFVTINEKTYLFYNDSSTFGAGYTKYIDIASEVIGEDTDDDGENDRFALPESTFVGKYSATDRVALATARVAVIENSLTVGVLPMEKDENGKLYNQEVIDARKAYDNLSESDKENFTEETLAQLEKYEKAIQMANEYIKLEGMRGYENKNTNEQTQLKNTYFAIKDTIIEFIKSEDFDEISAYIDKNVKWYFTEAYNEFE